MNVKTIQPISLDTHKDKHFKTKSEYSFAAQEAVCPLAATEVPRATLSLPIAIMKAEDSYILVALQGFLPGSNLLVGSNGQWLGGYLPSRYRAHPFLLLDSDDGSQRVLCIDETSQIYTSANEGVAFYTDDKPTEALKSTMEFLLELDKGLHLSSTICSQLKEYNLIQEWPIVLSSAKGERSIDGLFRLNEDALNQLPPEALKELQKSGALLIAYSQLLSMSHIHWLKDALLAKEKSSNIGNSHELDLEFLNNSEGLNFGGL